MSEQKNSAPRPLNDEELEAATGGAVGFNPLLHLSGDPYSPVPSALVVTGTNPLYVAPAEPYVPLVVPQAHAPVPQPAPASAPEPEPSVIVMTSDAGFGGGSLNIATPISTKITLTGTATVTGGTTVEPTPEPKPEVLTFGTQPTYTEVTATVRGVRPAGSSNNNDRIAAGGSLSPLEVGFDLSLSRS